MADQLQSFFRRVNLEQLKQRAKQKLEQLCRQQPRVWPGKVSFVLVRQVGEGHVLKQLDEAVVNLHWAFIVASVAIMNPLCLKRLKVNCWLTQRG